MKILVQADQSAGLNMRIHLRGGHVCVAQHILNHAQIYPILKQVRGK